MRRQKLRRKNLAAKFRGKICPQKIRADNCVRNPDAKTAAPRRGRGRGVDDADGSERLDAAAQTRQLARRRVLVHDTVADAAMQLGLRLGERGARRFLVAALDGGLDLLHEGTKTRDASTVDRGATLALT